MKADAEQDFIRLFHFISPSIKSFAQHFQLCILHLITADLTNQQDFLSHCGWLHTHAQERGLWALALPARRPGDAHLEESAGTDTLLGLRPRMWCTRRFFKVSRGLNLVSGLWKQWQGHTGAEQV